MRKRIMKQRGIELRKCSTELDNETTWNRITKNEDGIG